MSVNHQWQGFYPVSRELVPVPAFETKPQGGLTQVQVYGHVPSSLKHQTKINLTDLFCAFLLFQDLHTTTM